MKNFRLMMALLLGIMGGGYGAHAEESVEAILAPGIGFQRVSEKWKSGMRAQYSLDLARVSAGVSLNLVYGRGLGYADYGAVLRFFGHRTIVQSLEELSVWYGLGVGARYAGSVDATTGLSSTTQFGRAFLSPFTRVMYDLNGWIAPFIDLSFDFGVAGFGDSPSGLDSIKSGFVGFIGVAFEIER
jgi:hypothetical protein